MPAFVCPARLRGGLARLACVVALLTGSGCVTPPDQCVDPAVCDSVMADLSLMTYKRRASRRFMHEGGEYHFVQITLEPGLCCAGDDQMCLIRSPEGETSLFGLMLSDADVIAALPAGMCSRGATATSHDCNLTGYESPLVESLEFARWGDDSPNGDFMKWCRISIAEAQFFGFIPTPDELTAP